MRQSDDLFDPQVLAELEAIDATLRGEAVDPAYAELAEVALLLTAERPPAPRREFTGALDARVARRFKPLPQAAAAAPATAPASERVPAARIWDGLRRWLSNPAAAGALAVVVVAAVVAVIVLPGASNSGSSFAGLAGTTASAGTTNATSGSSTTSATATTSSGSSYGANASGTASASGGAGVGGAKADSGKPSQQAATTPSTPPAANRAFSGPGAVPAPDTHGRKVIQSAQIQLGARNARIDEVSQELFNVVTAENGIVEQSQVTTGKGTSGFGTFTLSIPTANLESSMDKLSSLDHSYVISRREATHDVTSTYGDDKRALADAKALRASLLKQLESAYTTGLIDSLKAQIQSAERQIRAAESRLGGLQHSISYSTLRVQINARDVIVPRTHHSDRFTISRAAHDALRVLVVAGGVVLIALAVLIPLGLIVGLLMAIGFSIRQRRREHALDEQ